MWQKPIDTAETESDKILRKVYYTTNACSRNLHIDTAETDTCS